MTRWKPVWTALSVLLMVGLATPVALADGPGGRATRVRPLTGEIVYVFVGHLGETDDEGRTLIWEGTIQGDISGTMKWWFGPSPAPGQNYLGGTVAYYAGRWEIWDHEGQNLLLAGESAGKTVSPITAEGERLDGMWDGHGVVTEARGRFNPLKGRHIYETGPVIWDFPFYGTGIFTIH
jgi:hypothetical protein